MVREPAGTPEGNATPEQVLIVQTLGAPHPERRKRRLGRKAKPVDSPPPLPDVPLTRATIVASAPFEDEAAAGRWLEEVADDPESRGDRARDALAVLNRGLGALREVAEDPLVHDASFHGALSIRLGYGSGDQLADGHWTQARDLPAAPHARHENLDAQRRAALELAGIDADAADAEADADASQ